MPGCVCSGDQLQEPWEENVLVDWAGSGWLISPPNVRGGSFLEENQEVSQGWGLGVTATGFPRRAPAAARRAAEPPAHDLELSVKWAPTSSQENG